MARKRNEKLANDCGRPHPQPYCTCRACRRMADHPMYTADDLAYLRSKGYSDDEVLAFWDRDHAAGCEPVHHRDAPKADAAARPHRTTRQIERELARIAKKDLGVETLQTRNSDGLDFHNLAVWQLRAALLAAFELGRQTS